MGESNFTVKVTPIAIEDLDSIYSHISGELFAEEAVNKLMDKIETGIMGLKDFPFSCPFVTDEFLKLKGYRKLIIDNYVAFYIVDEIEKQVVIMRVLYGRRKYEDLL